MNRRSFLAALCAAPFIPVAAKAAHTETKPFVFRDGTLYLTDIRVNRLSALSSVLGNVDISSAYIVNLIVGTSNIALA
jgi:hypothetical protein